ncbi:hypothetical protein ColLi_12170 [Colletotrichum liriopes]|uniref:Uncharacterized protein n=1 Tax=Colletotrichum liriopes TaxID=708192 RepID=A0AA37GYG0_9PEZI|nr:hypothetical protein ColLi_12170 [Colletotrichum liriopes]
MAAAQPGELRDLLKQGIDAGPDGVGSVLRGCCSVGAQVGPAAEEPDIAARTSTLVVLCKTFAENTAGEPGFFLASVSG